MSGNGPPNVRPLAEAAPVLDTLPDIARKLRRSAEELGATEYSLFFAVMRAGRPALAAAIDSAYPGASETSRRLVDAVPEPIIARLLDNSTPFAWHDGAERVQPRLAGLRWDSLVIDGAAGVSGLVFPVFTEKNQRGAVFFTGGAPRAQGAMIWDIHGRCLQHFAVVARLRPLSPTRVPAISKRELECLKLTAGGHTSEEIAAALGLSVHTANQYLANIAQKLNAMNRIHAVAKAIKLGIIE